MKTVKSVALHALRITIEDIIDTTRPFVKKGQGLDNLIMACTLQPGQTIDDYINVDRIKKDLNEAYTILQDYTLKIENFISVANQLIDNNYID